MLAFLTAARIGDRLFLPELVKDGPIRLWTFATVAAVVSVLPPVGARAAPQMLGLVATDRPLPMTCADGVCSAEASTFCLQRNRSRPVPGTLYTAVDNTKIVLVVTRADGTVVRRPAKGLVRIVSARWQFAVHIQLSETAKARLGAVKVSVAIAPLASAAPVPVPGDRNPLTKAEIAETAGPLRKAAGTLVEAGGDRNVAAARIVNRMINALPAQGRATPKQAASLWARTVGPVPGTKPAGPGRVRAAEYYRWCLSIRRAGGGMLSCLQYAHDGWMGRFNLRYWKIVNAGS